LAKIIRRILLGILGLVILAVIVFGIIYFTRIKTISSLQKITSYDKYNVYSMTVSYDYDLDGLIASGDGRVIEYDCESETRELTVTPSEAVTNFFIMYKDKVLPDQKNGIYGHGRERYDAILSVFEEDEGSYSKETAWNALKAAAQDPNPEDVTSNTQWSIVYNNTNLTLEASLRRDWDNIITYSLTDNVVNK
jgi:hypothetical protein